MFPVACQQRWNCIRPTLFLWHTYQSRKGLLGAAPVLQGLQRWIRFAPRITHQLPMWWHSSLSEQHVPRGLWQWVCHGLSNTIYSFIHLFRFHILMQKHPFFFPFESASIPTPSAGTAKDWCFKSCLLAPCSLVNLSWIFSSLLFYDSLKIYPRPQGLLKEFFPPSRLSQCQLLLTVQSILIKKAAQQMKTAEKSSWTPEESFNLDKI